MEIVTTTENDIATITVSRPESLNALNRNVLKELDTALTEIEGNRSLKVLIITGAGKAFVAGADIKGMSEEDPKGIASYVELGQNVMRKIECLSIPVIAAVNGFALGGGLELALSCDLIFASQNAKVGQPEVNLGIIPGFGGTQRLIHRCGVGTTRRLCYSGEIIGADEALSLGIVDKIFPAESFMAEVKKFANLVASKGPLAVKEAKRVIREAHEGLLVSGLRLEVDAFIKLFASNDRKEGMMAFLEKRTPNFKGN